MNFNMDINPNFKSILIICFIISTLTILSGGTIFAEDINLSGKFQTDLAWNQKNDQLSNWEKINLTLTRKFGFDADLHLDFGVNTDSISDSTETDINEAYLNYYTQNMDWRVGRQIINWGSSFKLQPTSYFNPRDYTVLKPEDERLGVEAVKGIYYAPDRLEITGVITPFFKENNFSREQQKSLIDNNIDEICQGLSVKMSSLLGTNFNVIPDPSNPYFKEKVDDKAKNIQGGFKITKRGIKGFDLSASFYHGRDKLPALDLETTMTTIDKNDNEVTVNFVYPRSNRLGLNLIGDFNGMGFWTEAVYSDYVDEQFNDRIESAVGVDYKFENSLYMVVQAYYKQKRLDREQDTEMVNLHMEQPVLDFHQWDLNLSYDLKNSSYKINPQFTYSLTNSAELQVGGIYNGNDENSQTSLLSTEDMIYSMVKVEF